MTKLTDEEREKLEIPDGWRWIDYKDFRSIELRNVAGSRVSCNGVVSANYCGGEQFPLSAELALAVITAAGLNPWYERCRELEREAKVAQGKTVTVVETVREHSIKNGLNDTYCCGLDLPGWVPGTRIEITVREIPES